MTDQTDQTVLSIARWLRAWDTDCAPDATAWDELDDHNRQMYLDGARQLLAQLGAAADVAALRRVEEEPAAGAAA